MRKLSLLPVWLLTPLLLLAHGSGAQLLEGFGTIATSRFVIRYQHGISEDDARKVLEYLQRDYTYLTNKTGLGLSERLEVRIYGSVGRFLAEARLSHPWRAAYYAHGVMHVQPVQALVHRGLFDQALGYELAIALLETAEQKGCPNWLVQAFAVFHAGETDKLTPPTGVHLSSFSDLMQDIQVYQEPPQRDDVHYVLGLTMRFFIERYGEKQAFGVFRQFDGVSSVESVFKKVFKEDYPAIEKAWAKYIASHTSRFK